MSPKIFDCIVIGGGASAAHAAFPLVERGLSVLMIDGGLVSKENVDPLPNYNFDYIRANMENQCELFLGADYSGAVPSTDKHQADYMTTGRFGYMSKNTNFLPVDTQGFSFSQTLAKGGMTEIWGGASDVLDDEELRSVGISSPDMHENYQKVIDRVGISGEIEGYVTQIPAKLSTHSDIIYNRSIKFNDKLKNLNTRLKKSILALLTEDLKDRKKEKYLDLDYWDNINKSLYKAKYTIEELQNKSNFHYVGGGVVEYIEESNNQIKIFTKNFSGESVEYVGKYAIVAAGALNSVKILLRSFKLYDKKVKITSKPNVITPCIDISFIGKVEEPNKHSLCQLVLESTNKTNGFTNSYSQFYKYKSLLLFKLLKFFPLTRPESFSLLSLLLPSMVIVDSRFPSILNNNKTCELKSATPMKLNSNTKS
jgi:hypothetical protein